MSLIVCPLLVLIFVLCETAMPMLMAKIIDDGIMPKDMAIITKVAIYMLLIALAGLVTNVINVYISSRTAVGFGADLRSKLFTRIEQFSFAEIDKFSSASLVTRLTNDIFRLQMLVQLSLRLLLRSPMMLLMALFFVIRINPKLTLIVAAAIPLMALGVYLVMRKGMPLFLKVQKKLDKVNSIVRENLINIRVVKSFVREKFEEEKFEESNEELRDFSIKASNAVIAAFPLMQLIMNLSVVAVLWFGGNMVIGGSLKVGELVSLVNYLMQILMSLMMLSMIIMNFARASASSERIVEVLDTEPSLKNSEKGEEDLYRIEDGDVEFKGVYFKYPGGDEDVLSDISFRIERGKRVAVVGSTGSGKSTLVQLIPRLYDVTVGEVLIDGVDVRSYNMRELHQKIGVVLQKNELFTGTIEENLRWGKVDATQEEIEAAAKIAQAHDFITSFPKGYQTVLGRGGVNVSGGQKQRLCIARALLRYPKILILDDSTSAVDTETEKKIRSGLDRVLGDTTLFIITQRVETMDASDLIIILDEGKIEMIGTPDELREKSDIYKELREL